MGPSASRPHAAAAHKRVRRGGARPGATADGRRGRSPASPPARHEWAHAPSTGGDRTPWHMRQRTGCPIPQKDSDKMSTCAGAGGRGRSARAFCRRGAGERVSRTWREHQPARRLKQGKRGVTASERVVVSVVPPRGVLCARPRPTSSSAGWRSTAASASVARRRTNKKKKTPAPVSTLRDRLAPPPRRRSGTQRTATRARHWCGGGGGAVKRVKYTPLTAGHASPAILREQTPPRTCNL